MPDSGPDSTTPLHATVMFADIAGSTDLYARLGDAAATGLVTRILEVTASTIRAGGGTPLRTQGDDVLCMFAEAGAAVRAAGAIHAAVRGLSTPASGTLEMRIGINSGPALVAEGEIFGDTVNVTARLAALAKGGQTLLTGHTLDDLDDQGSKLIRPLGELSLKGKSGTLELFEICDTSEPDEITQMAPLLLPPIRSSRLHLRFKSHHDRLDYLLVRYLLGRAPDCHLVVDHPLVSRHHAEIRFENGEFILRDFSTNGTVVVSAGVSRSLHHGQAALKGRGSILLGRTGFDRRLEIAFHADGG